MNYGIVRSPKGSLLPNLSLSLQSRESHPHPRFAVMHHSELVSVRIAKGKGRGVFALRDIAKGELIERVPVVVIPAAAFAGGWQNGTLNQYFYVWTKNTVAISLGYGSIYNHSYEPNAIYDHDYRNRRLNYLAYRDIAEGEEITVNYNYDPKDKQPMRFDVVEEKSAKRKK